jgi:UDP-glucose:(heptosyl)LPS alpha-1,3-glucosyltransferase
VIYSVGLLKIALVILHADPARGGAERYTVDLADDLVRRGHEVSLVASSFAPPPLPSPGIPEEGVKVREYRMAAGGATRLRRYLTFLDSLDAHLADNKYDVVHAMLPVRRCDVYHPHAGIAAETIEAGTGMQRFANRFNRKRQKFAAVEREMLEAADGPIVLCLSDYVKKTARRFYPQIGEKRLVKLFNGIDLVRFDPEARPNAGTELRRRLGISAEKIVALMLAQDFERKGLKEAILALAKVTDRSLMLLVGGRDDPSAYRRLASSVGVAERVLFAGATDDPYAFYQAADFFVLPTRHDPCSLVVLEALVMGVPVISTVFNGACEVMTDGRAGVVLDDPGDIPALAAAVEGMLDVGKRRQWREESLALRPTLSQETHLHSLEAAYRSVAHKVGINGANDTDI